MKTAKEYREQAEKQREEFLNALDYMTLQALGRGDRYFYISANVSDSTMSGSWIYKILREAGFKVEINNALNIVSDFYIDRKGIYQLGHDLRDIKILKIETP